MRTKNVKILDYEVQLSERSAEDVLSLAKFASNKPDASLIISVMMLNQSLQGWIKKQKFSLLWKRRLRVKKLLQLSAKQIYEYIPLIVELETIKKKVKAEGKSVEKSAKD